MPVYVIDTLKPKNGLDFPVVEAIDVAVEGYSSLADAVTHFATDTAITALTANLQAQIDQIAQAAGTGSADTEVAQARVDAAGNTYSTLKARLDTEYSNQEVKIENTDEVIDKISEGYGNFLPVGTFNPTNVYGVDFTYTNGVISKVGTATATTTAVFSTISPINLKAGTYSFSSSPATSVFSLRDGEGTTISACNSSETGTFTLSEDTTLYLAGSVTNGNTYDTSFSFMLARSATAQPFASPERSAVDRQSREEITAAKVDADNVGHNTLKARLDSDYNTLKTSIDDKTAIVDKISEKYLNLLPAGTYEPTNVYGVDFTFSNGKLYKVGTATATTTAILDTIDGISLESGTYTFYSTEATSVIYLKDGDGNTVSQVNSGTNGTFTLNVATTLYLAASVTNGNTYNTSFSLMLVKGTSKPDWQEPVITAVDSVARGEIDNISTDMANITEIYGNLLPATSGKSTIYGVDFEYSNGIISKIGTGTVTTSQKITAVPSITLKAGTYTFYSSQSTSTFTLKNGEGTTISTINSSTNGTFTLESETTLEMYSTVNNGVTYNSTFNIALVEGYGTPAWSAPSTTAVDKYVREKMTQFANNNLTQKKWTVCGDSLSAGDFTSMSESEYKLPSGKYKGRNAVYSYYIGNRTDCNINNVALNGMALAHHGDDTRYCFIDNYETLIDISSDYLTLWFGVNDRLHSVPIGTIDSTDTNTFYGAWNTVLSYIRTNMPFAHVGIVITQGADVAAQQTYNEATRAVAAKYGYPILDLQLDTSLPLYIHCGERPNVDSAIRTMVDNTFKVSGTNAHPNPHAHEFISYTVEKWLLGL